MNAAGLCSLGAGALLATLSLVACERPGDPDPGPPAVIASSSPLAQAGGQFGCDLFAQLAARDAGANILFSPASVSTALAVTTAGARGHTAQEIRDVFHWGLDDAELAEGMRRLAEAWSEPRDGSTTSVANALWGDRDMRFLDEFTTLAAQDYGASLGRVNFGEPAEACAEINAWVERETGGRVRELVTPGIIAASTGLVLTNSIHFSGTWLTRFDESLTVAAPFYLGPERRVEVPMMRLRNVDIRYFEDALSQIVELPYANQHVSMLLILPRDGAARAEIERRLSAERLQDWRSAVQRTPLAVLALPKFRFGARYSLRSELERLGMPTAFTPSADFSGMTGSRDLFLSEVIHEAAIEIDEHGTVAAAATAAVMTKGERVELPRFVADRPFLFAIMDEATGAPLFLGRLTDPQPLAEAAGYRSAERH